MVSYVVIFKMIPKKNPNTDFIFMQITGDVTRETQEWDGRSYCMTSLQQLQHLDPSCTHKQRN
jgi:hypothetical protein